MEKHKNITELAAILYGCKLSYKEIVSELRHFVDMDKTEAGIIMQVSREELKSLINKAVTEAMPNAIEKKPEPFIKGIHELAEFLKVGPSRAQKLKNEGAFPFWQDGRTLLFDPDKVRAAMENVRTYKKKSKA